MAVRKTGKSEGVYVDEEDRKNEEAEGKSGVRWKLLTV